MWRIQLRIPGVLGEPDVVPEWRKGGTVELHAGVDAIVGGPIRRQAARIIRVNLVKREASARSLQGVLHNDAERAKVGEAMASLAKFKENFLPVARQLETMGFDSARVAAAFMERARPDYDAAQRIIEALATDLNAQASAGGKRLEATATLVMALLGGSGRQGSSAQQQAAHSASERERPKTPPSVKPVQPEPPKGEGPKAPSKAAAQPALAAPPAAN